MDDKEKEKYINRILNGLPPESSFEEFSRTIAELSYEFQKAVFGPIADLIKKFVEERENASPDRSENVRF